MKKTQVKLVASELAKLGAVRRNWALENYISRLASIINQLNKIDGVLIEGSVLGKDYVYRIISGRKELTKYAQL